VTPPAAAAAPQRARPRPAPRPAPRPRPRRVSGPARPQQQQGLALGALSALETVSTHRLLDRLIRSRAWIGLIAFALIGIVALQLGLLQLNSGIGRSLEREALLQRENASLNIENSELAGGDRVEEEAKRLGMGLVSEKSLRFLSAHPHADASHATRVLQTPVVQHSETTSASSEASAEGAAEPTETGESTGAQATPESSGGESTEVSAAAGAREAAPVEHTTPEASSPAEANGGTSAP
jgi:hypothetical protein